MNVGLPSLYLRCLHIQGGTGSALTRAHVFVVWLRSEGQAGLRWETENIVR